jgi:hypothetical protein
LLVAEAKASRLETSLLAATRAQAAAEASVAAVRGEAQHAVHLELKQAKAELELLAAQGGCQQLRARAAAAAAYLRAGGLGGGEVSSLAASDAGSFAAQASAAVSLRASLLVSEANAARLARQLDAALRRADDLRDRLDAAAAQSGDAASGTVAHTAALARVAALQDEYGELKRGAGAQAAGLGNDGLEAQAVSAKAAFLVAEAKCWQLENELAAAQAHADAATSAFAVMDHGRGGGSELVAALADAQAAFGSKLAKMAATLEQEAAGKAAAEWAAKRASAAAEAASAEANAAVSVGGGSEENASRLQARLAAKQVKAAVSPAEEASRLQARLAAKAAAAQAGESIEPAPEAHAAATKLQALRRQKDSQVAVARKRLGTVDGEDDTAAAEIAIASASAAADVPPSLEA